MSNSDRIDIRKLSKEELSKSLTDLGEKPLEQNRFTSGFGKSLLLALMKCQIYQNLSEKS